MKTNSSLEKQNTTNIKQLIRLPGIIIAILIILTIVLITKNVSGKKELQSQNTLLLDKNEALQKELETVLIGYNSVKNEIQQLQDSLFVLQATTQEQINSNKELLNKKVRLAKKQKADLEKKLALAYRKLREYENKEKRFSYNRLTLPEGQIRKENFTVKIDDLEIDMIYVQGGTYEMGNNAGAKNEKPARPVEVSSFCISKLEINHQAFLLYCKQTSNSLPNIFKINNTPGAVVNISWNDANDFCAWLSNKTGLFFRLPTEAEWEYAARGGVKSSGYKYAGSNKLSDVGWYSGNSNSKVQRSNKKQANELGIYDMSGNVSEWCEDWYKAYKVYPEIIIDPQGPGSSAKKVCRGGNVISPASECTVSSRTALEADLRTNTIGFRIVLPSYLQ